MNELVEAADDKQLGKIVARYGRVDRLEIDELGYLELDLRVPKTPSMICDLQILTNGQ